jgi:hypothetical protein
MPSSAPDRSSIDSSTWWSGLEPQWKKAFNEASFEKGPVEDLPSREDLDWLLTTSVLRLAGPKAAYPNLSFELTNLSGVTQMKALETLSITDHAIQSLTPLSGILGIKSLFLNNNKIDSLDGIQQLEALEMLYLQNNNITSISLLGTLYHLKEVYLSDNKLTSLAGLTEDHGSSLQNLFVLPNANLPMKEVMRVENELGLRCRKA